MREDGVRICLAEVLERRRLTGDEARPDWPKPISIVTREIDLSSGLLQTPYCPRNLVTSEFYISGTEPTRDCDKHLAYGTPGYAPIDTLSTIPPPSGGLQPPYA